MTSTPPPAPEPTEGDPSMEEILASIRRILNEDEQPDAGDETVGAPALEDDVLVLDQSMLVSSPAPEPLLDDDKDAVAAPPPQPFEVPVILPEPVNEAVSDLPLPPAQSPGLAPELVAPEAAAAAASSVGSLMRTLAAGRSMQVYSGGPTLEDIVRAELRPLLKDWLDTNLPPLVERLVRTEIERVVGRAIP